MTESAPVVPIYEEDALPLLPKPDVHIVTQNRRLRLVCITITFACGVMWIALLATSTLYPVDGTYRPKYSCLDVAVTEWIAMILFLIAALTRSHDAITVAKYGSWWLLLADVSKLWVYRGWHMQDSLADSIAFPISLAAMWIRVVCVGRIRDLNEPAEEETKSQAKKLKWSSVKKILKPYIAPQRFYNRILVLLTYVALGASKACDMVSPLVLGNIVTNLSNNPPESAINLLLLYTALTIAPVLFSEIQDVLYVKVGQTAFKEVAETTFTHVHALSLDWHLKKKMGNVIRSIDRGQQAADNLMYYGVVFFVPAIGMAAATFILFAAHFDQAEIAAICFLGFGSYIWSTYVVTLWRRKFRQGMNKSDNAMHDKSSDSLINFETVKYFSNEEFEINEYIKLVRDYQSGGYKSQASVSLLNITQNTLIQLSMLGTLSVAAYCIVNHEDGFTVGEFVAVQAYVLTIFAPLTRLGAIYTVIINSMVDIQNLSELLDEKPDIVDKPNAIDFKKANPNPNGVGIEFKNVWFRYPSQPEGSGLKGISFTVAPGTTTAIVGETGSGKTTVSRLLFRFYDLLSGDITLNGISVKDLTQKSLRQSIGVVPQDTVMFNDTVAYNIKYGKLDATQAEIEDAAIKAQVHRFIGNLEKKYETMVGERGLKLSGGEKQRLAIARCLLKNPPVVLLDEATSALDNRTEKEVQRALQCLAGRTTLVIAHRLTTIKHAEQIIVMRHGEIVERGTHEELLALGPEGYYHSMWNAQLMAGETKGAEASVSSTPPPELTSPKSNDDDFSPR